VCLWPHLWSRSFTSSGTDVIKSGSQRCDKGMVKPAAGVTHTHRDTELHRALRSKISHKRDTVRHPEAAHTAGRQCSRQARARATRQGQSTATATATASVTDHSNSQCDRSQCDSNTTADVALLRQRNVVNKNNRGCSRRAQGRHSSSSGSSSNHRRRHTNFLRYQIWW